MKRLSVLMIAVAVFSVLLAACGGGAGSDPVATVKELTQVMMDKKFEKIPDYLCAAQKESFKKQLESASTGIDLKSLLDMMTITFENPQYTVVSQSEDKATVQMKAKLIIKVDREKFKALTVEMMKNQGVELPEEQIAPLIEPAIAQLEAGQQTDSPMQLVKENGKWVVCGSELSVLPIK